MYDSYHLFLVLNEGNDALSTNEGIQQFCRGLVVQLFIEELRNSQLVLHERNLVVCWVAKLTNGEISMPGSDSSTSVVYKENHLNTYFWKILRGGCYSDNGVVLMMKIAAKQEDLPLGDSYPQLVARIVKILNQSIADPRSPLSMQLCPFGQIFTSTVPPCESEIPDHEGHAEARQYRDEASIICNRRYLSQDELSLNLNRIRKAQQEIVTAIKKRESWSHLSDEYQRREQETLSVAKDLSVILKECSAEEDTQVSACLAVAPPRSTAGDFFDTLSSRLASTVHKSNTASEMPSDQVSHLHRLELEMNQVQHYMGENPNWQRQRRAHFVDGTDRSPNCKGCGRNAWLNERVRRGMITLRCNNCRVTLRGDKDVVWDTMRCRSFHDRNQAFCDRGDSCPQMHIFYSKAQGKRATEAQEILNNQDLMQPQPLPVSLQFVQPGNSFVNTPATFVGNMLVPAMYQADRITGNVNHSIYEQHQGNELPSNPGS